jgi:diguanylate cyclase (GGDEF)-like protein/PAS domain S-box-containing protein
MTITPVRAESGEITHFVAIKQDVTTRKAIAEALLHAQEKYRGLVEDAVVGIFQATPDGRIITANAAMARMHGYDSPQQLMSEVSDAATQLFVNPNQLQEISRLLEKNEVAHDVEVEVNRRDGTRAWLLGNLRAVRGRDGRIVRHEGTVQDITERKAAEKQVQYLAYYDALTGLPNRTLFRDRLTKALASARRRKEKVALLFFDLDRFKTINDSLGHSVGDLLLKEVAERLKGWAREQDTVARLGGDEFVVVLTGIKEVADIAVAANRILNMMATEFAIQGQLLRVTCSLGISVFPDHGPDAEALLKSADAAMYYAIDKGGNNFQFFTQDMNARAMERLTLENSLRLALEREELFLVYQPQVDLPTGAIVGAEALLRWRHPQMGLVPPSKFIAIAENSGLMLPFGEWVLKTACAQARQWQDQGLPPLPIAVNVSAVQFRHERFLEVVREVLEESGLAPQYLELELTESLLLSSADVTLSLLRQLHGMGLRLSIDDFGTGYSSLSYLRHFPVYKLKIDRSFMQNITVSTDNAAVTAAIINLARSLNLKVLAEGVENEEQMFFLRAHNCDEVQGYYFSHPLAASDFAEKVRCTLPLAPGLPQDGKLLIRQSADLRTPNSHSKPREALASPLEI